MNQFPKGYQACGFHCGIKKAKDDLTVVVSDVPAAAAAVYTNNLFQAAPLVVTKAHLAQEGKAQAIVVNSGVANAAMGKQGIHDAEAVAKALADTFVLPEQYTIVASTGVIGMPLPVDLVGREYLVLAVLSFLPTQAVFFQHRLVFGLYATHV